MGGPVVRLLSPRQVKALEFAAQGLTHRQVAQELGVKRQTVKNQFQRIYDKLGLEGSRRNKTTAIMQAVRTGQLTLGNVR